MLKYGNKELRNLEEQVGKNKDDNDSIGPVGPVGPVGHIGRQGPAGKDGKDVVADYSVLNNYVRKEPKQQYFTQAYIIPKE